MGRPLPRPESSASSTTPQTNTPQTHHPTNKKNDRSSPHESNRAYIYNAYTVDFILQRLKEEPNHLDILKQKSQKNKRH